MNEREKQIFDIAYNRTIDKVNAFLKVKGLEGEFAAFRLPEPTAPKSHVINRAILEHLND